MASIAKFDQWQNSAGVVYGTILQVVYATFSFGAATTSGTYSNTGNSVSITPKFSNSKIIIVSRVPVRNNPNYSYGGLRWARGGTVPLATPAQPYETGQSLSSTDLRTISTLINEDTPGTTSLVTYQLQFASWSGSTYAVCESSIYGSAVLMEVQQ